MQHGAHIGPSVVVKGDVSAREPITIAGRVEGTIDVSGQSSAGTSRARSSRRIASSCAAARKSTAT